MSGEIFATRGGLVQRIAFHESKGLFDRDLTPEALRDRIGEVMAADGAFIASQAEHGRTIKRLLSRAKLNRSAAGRAHAHPDRRG